MSDGLADRAMRLAAKILLDLCALALALMMGVLCWQVFARYVLNSSPAWAEQSALLLMLWMTFLGAAGGIAHGFHIRIAEGIAALPDRWAARAVQVANMLVIASGLLLAWEGAHLVGAMWHNEVPTLPLTRGMVFLVIPVCGALMTAFAAVHLTLGHEIGGSRGSA